MACFPPSSREDIAAGKLKHLLPEWTIPELPFYAVHTGPRTLPLRTRTVLDFLIEISNVLRQG